METGAIVGIVLGSVALLLVVGFLVYWYWWKPYHNKTQTASSELDVNFNERTRRRLMDLYDIQGDLDGPEAQIEVNEAQNAAEVAVYNPSFE